MATVRTCITPEDGWGLVGHFLGNKLAAIALQQELKDEEADEETLTKRDRVISDAWAKLVGSLYMIMRRMLAHGHQEDAAKMQQIIDMTVELDLADPETHKLIYQKNAEFYNRLQGFKDAVTELEKKYGK